MSGSHLRDHQLKQGLMPFICAIDNCGFAFRTLGWWKCHAKNVHNKQENGNVSLLCFFISTYYCLYFTDVGMPLFDRNNKGLLLTKEQIRLLTLKRGPDEDATATEEIVDASYGCPVPDCCFTFSEKSHVTDHVVTSKGVMPFICTIDECGYAHRTMGAWKKHAEKMHDKQKKGYSSLLFFWLKLLTVYILQSSLYSTELVSTIYHDSNKSLRLTKEEVRALMKQ